MISESPYAKLKAPLAFMADRWRMTGNPDGISSPLGLVPTNALLFQDQIREELPTTQELRAVFISALIGTTLFHRGASRLPHFWLHRFGWGRLAWMSDSAGQAGAEWFRWNRSLHPTGGLTHFDLAGVSVDYEDPQIIAVLAEWEHEESELLWIVGFRCSG